MVNMSWTSLIARRTAWRQAALEHQTEPPGATSASLGVPRPGVSSVHLLVVDADPVTQRMVTDLGLTLLIDISTASSDEGALQCARTETPDAVFIDADRDNPGALADRLRELPGCEALPLAFMSSIDSLERRVAAVHAGASSFLLKPVEADDFGIAVHQLTLRRDAERTRVLVLDDDVDFCDSVASLLNAEGMRTTLLHDPSDIITTLVESTPDLLLLDCGLPGVSGLEVFRLLRADPRWQDLPILALTGDNSRETRMAAYQAGADDYLVKPVLAAELITRVNVRIERARLRRERAEKDALTGLLLRRGFLDQASARLSEARRLEHPLSVCLLDLDLFKRVNDDHGHLAGDRVLAELGRLMTCRFRAGDVRGRWGGEEFALVFPGQDLATVAGSVRRLLGEFSARQFVGDRGEVFQVEFSAGVASFPEDGRSLEALLAVADRRLYQGKSAGRARVWP